MTTEEGFLGTCINSYSCPFHVIQPHQCLDMTWRAPRNKESHPAGRQNCWPKREQPLRRLAKSQRNSPFLFFKRAKLADERSILHLMMLIVVAADADNKQKR